MSYINRNYKILYVLILLSLLLKGLNIYYILIYTIIYCAFVFLLTNLFVDKYLINVNNIFKRYSYNLAELSKSIEVNKRKIINVHSIEDLMNARCNNKEPIFYYVCNNGYEFYLLNKKEIYTLILKK